MAQADWVEQGSDVSLWNTSMGRGWDSGRVDKCVSVGRVKKTRSQDDLLPHSLTTVPRCSQCLLSSHLPTLPLPFHCPTIPLANPPHWLHPTPTACILPLPLSFHCPPYSYCPTHFLQADPVAPSHCSPSPSLCSPPTYPPTPTDPFHSLTFEPYSSSRVEVSGSMEVSGSSVQVLRGWLWGRLGRGRVDGGWVSGAERGWVSGRRVIQWEEGGTVGEGGGSGSCDIVVSSSQLTKLTDHPTLSTLHPLIHSTGIVHYHKSLVQLSQFVPSNEKKLSVISKPHTITGLPWFTFGD